jgi:hypothetical protein
VAPNHEGIFMVNCGRNGIEDFSVVSGKVNTLGICTELFQVPMYEQTGDVEELPLVLSDGTTGFSIDPEYTYKAIRGKGRDIIFNFKHLGSSDGFLDAIEENILSRRVKEAYRDIARNYTADSLLNNMNAFEEAVKAELMPIFEQSFFTLSELTSGLTPPKQLSESIGQRNQEISEAKRELERMNREMNRLEVEKSKAQAQVEISKLQAQSDIERSRGLTDPILEEMKIKAWEKAGCPVPQAVTENSWYNVGGKKQ